MWYIGDMGMPPVILKQIQESVWLLTNIIADFTATSALTSKWTDGDGGEHENGILYFSQITLGSCPYILHVFAKETVPVTMLVNDSGVMTCTRHSHANSELWTPNSVFHFSTLLYLVQGFHAKYNCFLYCQTSDITLCLTHSHFPFEVTVGNKTIQIFLTFGKMCPPATWDKFCKILRKLPELLWHHTMLLI
jgi:hypothetical protein